MSAKRVGLYSKTVALGVLALAWLACGAPNLFNLVIKPTPTPTPTATPAPTPTPTSTPTPAPTVTPTLTPTLAAGVSVPVVGGHWLVTINNVHLETSVSQGDILSRTTWKPPEGSIFLVVDATFYNLDPFQATSVSTDSAAIITEDGEIITAVGGGSGEDDLSWSGGYCASCIVTTYAYGSEQLSVGFVFMLDEDETDQVFKLQYQEYALISFSVGDQMEYPFTTEIGGEAGLLPLVCQAWGTRPQEDAGQLAFRREGEVGFDLVTAAPDGADMIPLCTGIAYGDVQLAADGAALLLLGPQQGWPSLSLAEPGGEVYSLIRNGQEIEARFDPSGRWVIFSTLKVGETGRGLYIFDRETASTTLVKEGDQISFRFDIDGRLLVKYRADGDDQFEYYVGQADGSTLESLQLPAVVPDRAEIMVDGQHVVYRKESRLFVANLDGSDVRELTTSEDGTATASLSPDSRFALVNTQDSVRLHDLTTGESETIVESSGSLNFAFSADSRWGLIFDSECAQDADSGGGEGRCLYVVHTADGRVQRTIPDVVNAFFSPDCTQLAYTVKGADGAPQIYVLSLENDMAQLLGPGILTGWFPRGVVP